MRVDPDVIAAIRKVIHTFWTDENHIEAEEALDIVEDWLTEQELHLAGEAARTEEETLQLYEFKCPECGLTHVEHGRLFTEDETACGYCTAQRGEIVKVVKRIPATKAGGGIGVCRICGADIWISEGDTCKEPCQP